MIVFVKKINKSKSTATLDLILLLEVHELTQLNLLTWQFQSLHFTASAEIL